MTYFIISEKKNSKKQNIKSILNIASFYLEITGAISKTWTWAQKNLDPEKPGRQERSFIKRQTSGISNDNE